MEFISCDGGIVVDCFEGVFFVKEEEIGDVVFVDYFLFFVGFFKLNWEVVVEDVNDFVG